MRLRLVLLEVYATFVLSIGLLAASTEAGPVFMGLGDLPGGSSLSIAHAVSADGAVVVGMSSSASGLEAFSWTLAGGMSGLGDLPGGEFRSEAFDVSADGSVIVGSSRSFDGPIAEAFRWESGVMTGLGDFEGGSFASGANGVSADGSVVVGGGTIASGSEAFRWTGTEGLIGLGDLPGGSFVSNAQGVSADGTVVVGGSATGNSDGEAFRWTSETGMVGLGFLPGGGEVSAARAISSDGSTIIGISDSVLGTPAFRWTELAGMMSLDALLGPSAISDDASVIVGAYDGRALIWTESFGLRDLQELLETDFGVDLDGWTLESARDISSDGTVIVGTGTNPFGRPEGWIAVIPEPTTLALLAAGAWLIPRRRNRFGG